MANFSPLSTLKKITNPTASPREPGLLGRFELRRILGHGAQSVVWLGFDPRLEREVAIKLMKMEQGEDPSTMPSTMTGWLQEARSVSRLTHPGIVPLFEADAHNQQPYLVFEYVEGQTLSTLLGKRGALPTSESVALALEMLEALMVAHTAGVIHRDLKPSNVMINPAGRARIMDFGIAAQAQVATGSEAADRISGTPGYLSPEAAKGLPPTVLMDVFAVGVVLTEMLSGRSLIAERDPHRAIQRVIDEQLTLPADLSADVDDRLRAIIMRGLARDPLLRHASAQVFRDELVSWLGVSPAPEGAATQVGTGGGGSGTLDFLLRRMRHKTDFPALSNSIIRIQGLATSETESVGNVTSEILKDVALTNKLLRLVNSAHFARGGSISTVSRAVSLVGFNGIRNMALSLVLLERMQDRTHATVLKEEFLRALMAGSIAGELSAGVRGSEEAFIGALFQNLGRLLAEFYFPEEARTVRSLCTNARNPVSEATASASVLGLNYEALGTGVAKAWGLPDDIQRSMCKPVGEPPTRLPTELSERLRWTAGAANEMADILLHSEPKEVDARLSQVARRYAKALGVSVAEIQATTVVARKKLIDMASAMDLHVMAGSAASKLLNEPTAADLLEATHHESSPDSLSFLELHATEVQASAGAEAAPVAKPANQVAHILAAGIQEITDSMVDDFKLSDVLRMILETMLRALDFRHVVFCMRDPKIDALTGRFGLGQGVDTLVKAFHISLKATPTDLFSVVCLKGADTMISDATEPHLAKRLPAWYRNSVNAPTFLLLPLMIKGRPFGLIYADKADKGGLVLDEKELALLRTLRNQAVVAFKQSS
jgi:serine/threonine protein kinase